MKTYDVSVKRVEHGHILIEADSVDEVLSRINDGDFDDSNVDIEWGYNDENWAFDEEWGATIVKENE